MQTIRFRAVPTFGISDVNQAKAFYLEFLGFELDWEHRFSENEPIYMQVSLNGMVLHLAEHTRFKSGVVIFIEATGLEDYCRELAGRSPLPPPVVTVTGWNTRQVEIEDPFGNLLRFNENIVD